MRGADEEAGSGECIELYGSLDAYHRQMCVCTKVTGSVNNKTNLTFRLADGSLCAAALADIAVVERRRSNMTLKYVFGQ